jgi:hypothetical protein
MEPLCSSSYVDVVDAMRDVADRQKQSAARTRAMDYIRAHNGAVSPVASLVNYLGPITRELGPDADVQAHLREAAERHEQLAKVLWAYARDLAPVRALEAAE